jgi:hypothetical protein
MGAFILLLGARLVSPVRQDEEEGHGKLAELKDAIRNLVASRVRTTGVSTDIPPRDLGTGQICKVSDVTWRKISWYPGGSLR